MRLTEQRRADYTLGRLRLKTGAAGAPILETETREVAKVLYHGGSEDAEAHGNARRLMALWNAAEGIPTETLEAGVVVVPVSKLDGALHDLAFEVMTRCVKGRTTILVDRVDQAIAKCKAHLQQNGGERR